MQLRCRANEFKGVAMAIPWISVVPLQISDRLLKAQGRQNPCPVPEVRTPSSTSVALTSAHQLGWFGACQTVVRDFACEDRPSVGGPLVR